MRWIVATGRSYQTSGSAPSHRDQLVALVAALLSLLEDVADPAYVHLVVDHAWLEWRPLLREQRVRSSGRRDGTEEADDLEVVFRVALEVLLLSGLADVRVPRHEDAGLPAVDACHPGALGTRDVSLCVELGGVLAEVPDVAARILAVPVDRALRQVVAEVEAIMDGDAGHALDLPRLPRDLDDVARRLAVLDPCVEVASAGEKREPGVVDAGGEARRGRHLRRAAGGGPGCGRGDHCEREEREDSRAHGIPSVG